MNFETNINLLQEILDKKLSTLTAVLTICENQEQLYLSPPSETRREFLLEMGKQKQIMIDEIVACDAVFQRIFDGIIDNFEENAKNFAEKARHLQNCIKEAIELDVKIRAQEQKSRMMAKESFGKEAAVINPANTNYILNQYRSHNKMPTRQEEQK